MKISYNWLKNYIDTDITADEASVLLTDCGLEVEGMEKFESLPGGLEGLVIGEVKTKEQHPNADRLSVTTVDVGAEALLHIVCGAPNVEAGQKVVVATVGAKLYPTEGEPFEIKKSKIRGEVSEGMICAEDEIGLGASHAGIMVLDENAVVGTPASEYFKVESDIVFEIGLTPNRADATSHIGVARDLVAVLNAKEQAGKYALKMPSVDDFKVDNEDQIIDVVVEDQQACKRYSGVTISGIEVKESPDWLKNYLKAIGLRPLNNVVDITNFILHETGQPLHAFDTAKIDGNKIVVKKLADATPFVTLDEEKRKLSANDLMICNATAPMCIAGVFGGIESGVTENTKAVFIESAYFDSVSIRKTSKLHGLKTDASFRFERGTDPNITVYALKRAAMLIKELAGGTISSPVVDVYPEPVKNFDVSLDLHYCDRLIGKKIDRKLIGNILKDLEIKVLSEDENTMQLSVPPFKVDVKGPADVVEEVLRIYGYNNVEIGQSMNISPSNRQQPDKERVNDVISSLLSDRGFAEIVCNSLTKGAYATQFNLYKEEENVNILNPLSADLNVMRQSLLFGGLEAIAYNRNRKNNDLRFYEFGKTYHFQPEKDKYKENNHLALFMCGRRELERWNTDDKQVDFFYLKGVVEAVLNRLGIAGYKQSQLQNVDGLSEGLQYGTKDKALATFGKVAKSILKSFDINGDVYYADFNWDAILKLLVKKADIQYREIPKFPAVRRDLALLLDKSVAFEEIEQLAYQTERKLLKNVELFDVYEGDKLENGKKSYAVSFILQDEEATLTDKQIERVMDKLLKTFSEKVGAALR